jgi:uncharacterized protein YlaI
MNKGQIVITNIEEVFELLNERGITLLDVQEAIAVGELTGRKFYRVDEKTRFLVRAKVGKFNVYAEYSCNEDEYILHTAYAHRVMIASDNGNEEYQGESEADWHCYMCQVKVEEVDNIAIRYNEVELPDIDGYRCPQCHMEMISENTVMTMLFMAEMMLEAK